MLSIPKLIELAKKNSGIPTDLHFAKALKVSQGAIWQWKNGRSLPTVENAHMLAEMAGIDPAEIVLDILMRNAEGQKLKATLNRFKSALAAAAVIMLTVLPGAGPLQVEENSTVNNIHYAQLAKAIFKALLRSFAIFPLGDPRDQATKMQSLLLPG